MATEQEIQAAVQRMEARMASIGLNPGAVDGAVDDAFRQSVNVIYGQISLLTGTDMSEVAWNDNLRAQIDTGIAQFLDSDNGKLFQHVINDTLDEADIGGTERVALKAIMAWENDAAGRASALLGMAQFFDPESVAMLDQLDPRIRENLPAIFQIMQEREAFLSDLDVLDAAGYLSAAPPAEDLIHTPSGQPDDESSANPSVAEESSQTGPPSSADENSDDDRPSVAEAIALLHGAIAELHTQLDEFGVREYVDLPGVTPGGREEMLQLDEDEQTTLYNGVALMKMLLGIQPPNGEWSADIEAELLAAMQEEENAAILEMFGGGDRLENLIQSLGVINAEGIYNNQEARQTNLVAMLINTTNNMEMGGVLATALSMVLPLLGMLPSGVVGIMNRFVENNLGESLGDMAQRLDLDPELVAIARGEGPAESADDPSLAEEVHGPAVPTDVDVAGSFENAAAEQQPDEPSPTQPQPQPAAAPGLAVPGVSGA